MGRGSGEFRAYYLYFFEVGAGADEDYNTVSGHIDHRLAHLSFYFEVALNVLCAFDAPQIALVEFKIYVERRRKVDRAGKRIVDDVRARSERVARDLDRVYVGVLGEVYCRYAVYCIYLCDAALSARFERDEIGLYARIGYIVFYTAGEKGYDAESRK